MEPKARLFKRSAAAPPGPRICSPTPPGWTPCCPDAVGGSPPGSGGLISTCSNAVYTVLVEDPSGASSSSLRRRARRRSCEDGAGGRGRGPPPLQPLWQKSPSHCNGKAVPGDSEPVNGRPRHLSDPLVVKRPEEEGVALRLLDQSALYQSAHIPVPRQRRLSEKAGIDEVIAAVVLTSLSTSPVVLNNPPNGLSTDVAECWTRWSLRFLLTLQFWDCIDNSQGISAARTSQYFAFTITSVLMYIYSTQMVALHQHISGQIQTQTTCDTWKEGPAMSSSYSSSSNNSGEWSWDPPSDLSTPSTPSPPLTADVATSFLSSLHPDLEETEASHFLFGDPIPRKRKNSTKVMFKCLWKNCGKVLSSSSGMQKHIRTIHLGRKADLDQSDGEEDFYYTELDVNVDSLTDGLSSLTPVSPTSSVPPAFPILEGEVLQTPAVPPLKPEVSVASHLSHSSHVTILSQSAPTGLCHVQTDHAYQGCLTPIRPVDLGEKHPQVPPVPVAKGHTLVPSSMPKPAAGTRKPRGEAKKCRKVYGMENRSMWCTACRWKKACQRFVD